jgi:hypothetical protein
LDDHALQPRLLLFDTQMDFVDATIGEDNLVNSRHTRLQTSRRKRHSSGFVAAKGKGGGEF